MTGVGAWPRLVRLGRALGHAGGVTYTIPTVPVSCGALLFDEVGRLLVLKPSYKSGWTLPGGQMEGDGETPWEGCRREVLEETGIVVDSGRLVAVDTRPAKKGRQLGVRFLFDCGVVTAEQIENIELQRGEILRFRFVERDDAMEMLRPAVRRRVASALAASECVYLEDGKLPPAMS